MLKRNVGGLGLSVVLLSLFVVVRVTAQGIPQGAASTDTGFGGANTISGMLVSPTGQRILRRVTVRLRTMTRGDQISTTDENGNFVFRNVPSGDFVVVIDKEKDFEPFSQTVSVIQPRGMPPQIYYLNIRLTAKEGTAGAPGVVNADLANVPKPALAKYNKAIELAKNGDRPGAILQLQDALADYPEFVLAYNEMGVQYMRLNDWEKADEALHAALKINPKAFMPLLNRGIVLVTIKRYADAEPLLREVVKMKSENAVGHYFLGQAVANLGNFDEAEKELSTAVKLGGDDMKEAHRLLAIIYSARQDKKHAIAELETYLRLVPTTPDAEQLRNVIQKLKGADAPTPKTKESP